MLFTETTGLGTIRYDQHIIGNIIRHVVERMDGRVFLSDPKGRMRKSVGKPTGDDVSFLDLKREEGVMEMTLYVVVKFGAGIRRAATEISESSRDEIARITGLSVDKVTVVVTGVLSKNLSKRHIEVIGYVR